MLKNSYLISVETQPLEEGGFLAICPHLPGCHAEGETVAEALENLEDVARNLIEMRMEDGLPIPAEVRPASPGSILHGEVLVTVA